MTDAWQTYHDQSRRMLDGAQDETSALVGVGWAVLALVEVLKPADEIQLADSNPLGLSVQVCDRAEHPHTPHVWMLDVPDNGRRDAEWLSAVVKAHLRWCTG